MNGKQAGSTPAGTVGWTMDMSETIRRTLDRARALHERGAIADAQGLYQGVLSIDPENAEALHLLGMAYDRAGDPQRGEPLIARSLKLERRYAWAYANHAGVLIRLSRHVEALVAVEHAVRLDARYAPALVCRGNALLGLQRYAEAGIAYDEALRIAPSSAEAWSNRGNALRALGRPADALISFDRALQLSPNDYATHTNRAHALRDFGRYEEALRSYRLALVIRPEVPELTAQCGTMLLTLGRDMEALACYDQALAVQPENMDVLYRSCIALDMTHQYEELLLRSERLLAHDPDHTDGWLARGNALQGLRRHQEAAAAYERALAGDGGSDIALTNQGVALRMLERYAEALENYDRALERHGASVQLVCSRAHTLQQLGRYDEALACYEQAITLIPTNVAGWSSRATALKQLMRYDEALACYQEIQKLDPHNRQAPQEEAYCRLVMGDFKQGWGKYESRWSDPDAGHYRRHADRPLWLGREQLAGKVILLHAEQGYGDTLQFCRYAPLLEARGATVVLEVPHALKGLLSSLQGVGRVIADDPMPAIDMQCPLLSLPLALGTTVETIPAEAPYLRADAGAVSKWGRRLGELAQPGKLKVGLAWSGNPRHNNDLNRSMTLDALTAVLALDAVFASLHQEVRERDGPALVRSGLLHFGDELKDFSDTAALIQNLDLVISVDTSVVHLAGALGKRVWVLLPTLPDWRWLLDRDDSPWYPTARVFRQKKPGDWPEVLQRVAHALARMIAQGGISQ